MSLLSETRDLKLLYDEAALVNYLPKNQEVKNCPNRKKEESKIDAIQISFKAFLDKDDVEEPPYIND